VAAPFAAEDCDSLVYLSDEVDEVNSLLDEAGMYVRCTLLQGSASSHGSYRTAHSE